MKQVSGESKLFAFLATFFTIIGFIIAIIFRRQDKYVMFYAKQGLVLFIAGLIIGLIANIPFFGWFLVVPLQIIFLIIWIFAWINALSGKMKDTFIIGEFAKKINL